jgi:DNA modification methylase
VTAYYADDTVTLLLGDTLEVLRTLPDESVNCCVTSPPYFGLRDYGQPGQYGLEPTPADYVDRMRQVFAQVRRILTDDGTCWLNLGDSFYSGKGESHGVDEKNQARRFGKRVLDGAGWGLTRKNLVGIPWRVAFALQDDGWTLRNEIVWHKPNAMPESVGDRMSTRHETLFLLTKSARYWFDLNPIREPLAHPEALTQGIVFGGNNGGEGKVGAAARRRGEHRSVYGAPPGRDRPKNGGTGPHHDESNPRGRNPGDVWSIPTTPFPGAHFAVFPPEIPRRCILAGCPEGGVVLDPFSGSATTGMVAQQLGRRYIGIDLNPEYHDLALKTRLHQSALPFGTGGAA